VALEAATGLGNVTEQAGEQGALPGPGAARQVADVRRVACTPSLPPEHAALRLSIGHRHNSLVMLLLVAA